jgi:thioredoxin reductase (NADPH)
VAGDDAFPTLDAADLVVLDDLGYREPVAAGDHLYRAGDLTYDLFVVTAGLVEILAEEGGEGSAAVRSVHEYLRFEH